VQKQLEGDRVVAHDRHDGDPAPESERPGGGDAHAEAGEGTGAHSGGDVRDVGCGDGCLGQRLLDQHADDFGVAAGVGALDLRPHDAVRFDDGNGRAEGRVDAEDHPPRVVGDARAVGGADPTACG
jgi:hypothetical protein